MKFETFAWGPRFECGIGLIDEQHHRLVDIINRLGGILLSKDPGALRDAVNEARAYAAYHFSAEESLWEGAGIDALAREHHHHAHREFTLLLDHFMQGFHGDTGDVAVLLHSYLSSWLIYHILGEDRRLAHQVLNGASVKEDSAANAPGSAVSTTESVLLGALQQLYGALTAMNNELRDANQTLEERVCERTVELQAANAQLGRERDELMRLNAELSQTRSRLLESEKMASVGQLAAGVAHEINNPIGFVTSNLGALGDYLADTFAVLDAYADAEPLIARDPSAIARLRAVKTERGLAFLREDAPVLLAESRAGLARVKQIVHDLRVFSHVDHSDWQRVDLRTGLESTLNIAAAELRRKAEVRREFADLPPVLCHAGQLNQVFMNLLTNAAQAIAEHGIITVRTGTAGDQVWVEVEDDGCGIPVSEQARVFEPFFTTKEFGKGTGLGLATVYGVVRQCGGEVRVKSALGTGTTFEILFPVVVEALEAPLRAMPAGSSRGHETLLLVEDADPVRAVLRKALEQLGYTVLQAEDGNAALAIARAGQSRFDLLITDAILPGVRGQQLAERIRAVRPGLNVLFMSGYAGDVIAPGGALEPWASFLQKPFSPDDLGRKIREMLDAPRSA